MHKVVHVIHTVAAHAASATAVSSASTTDPPHIDWFQDGPAFVQALAAVVIVIFTAAYVKYTKKLLAANQGLLETNQQLLLAQDAPYVSVVLTRLYRNDQEVQACEIENIGTGPAFDVFLQVVRKGSPQANNLSAEPAFQNVIPFLAPNRPIRYVVGTVLPPVGIDATVEVTFSDSRGKKTGPLTYLLARA